MAEAAKDTAKAALAPNATVTRFEPLAGCLFRLWVRPDWSLATSEWEAGQFVRLCVPKEGEEVKKVARAYSFVGVQGDAFEFYVVVVEGGVQTPRLHALREGDRVWCEQKINGHFTLSNNPDGKPDCWMIGTGAGIAPLMAFLRHGGEHLDRYEHVVLVHQVRDISHCSYGPELLAACRQRPGLRYVPIVSRPTARFHAKDGHAALFGKVGDLVRDGRLERVAGVSFSAARSAVMLCGHPDMIKDVRETLEARGLQKHTKKAPGNVVSERYW